MISFPSEFQESVFVRTEQLRVLYGNAITPMSIKDAKQRIVPVRKG